MHKPANCEYVVVSLGDEQVLKIAETSDLAVARYICKLSAKCKIMPRELYDALKAKVIE